MFNLQKCVTIIFVLLNLAPSVYSQVQNNEINPEYIKWIQGNHETVSSDGHPLGYIPPPYFVHTELPAYLKAQTMTREYLSPSFDLRTTGGLTSVKNQGNCGSCWTFATMGAIESCWKINGRGDYDLSEDNLNTCHSPFSWTPCNGGNSYISIACLVRGSGPKSESDDPYSDTHTSVDCPTGLNPQGLVTSGWHIPTTDPSLIKTLIQTYGALYTCFYYDGAYYNSSNYTYYYSGTANTNHAVTLVGWDDNKVTGGGTGAWIIKNSWGSSWGESGYFYIAYQDSKVNSEVTLFKDYKDYDPNGTIYTYSESGSTSEVGFSTGQADALVKFVATGNVQLTKIGTYTSYPGAIVSINVYDNFDGSSSLTGLLGSITAQTCTYTGYYTFDFSSPINLSNGNDYYVKISYQTTGYNYPIPVEATISGFNTPTYETGKCWVKSTGASTWISLDGYNWDLCIYTYSTTSALPVELTLFTASVENFNTILKWRTATETNNYGFEVERRAVNNQPIEVKSWQKIGFVQGNGSSNVTHSYSFTDQSLASGKYAYRLKQVDNSGAYKYSGEAEITIAVPNAFLLDQNYPNPFNPTTNIKYQLPAAGYVSLKVYDLLGREVAVLVDETKEAGNYEVKFDASHLTSGIYFSQLKLNGQQTIKKMILMK